MQRYIPHRPCLILLMGVAGTGKTTLAREIVHRVDAVYLDNNHIADAFFPDTRIDFEYRKLRPRLYQAMYTVAQANLMLGNSVLLDAPHIKEIQSPGWQVFIGGLAEQAKAALVVIRCICSEEALRARIFGRGEKRDEWKFEHWTEFLRTEPIEVPIPLRHLDVNTEESLSTNTAIAVRYIQHRAEGLDS